ncbi:MAG: Tryptophanyl-tRNA synthetase II [Candidatus Nomurabacteria bacterium GW2011_GWF2_35_66]|uniref:Tryptophan--tRNA ligase n=1 Tax=Candidatus Nomurabacteria bacterium GW2011_GWE1_35_16 TaxID=1618761 RepID=A0A0G0DU67_9BACT|nr:MAG: Tryptophanyl-tRNA synthetase II [Candidatus Nomurabacteria bacterium GW2011_GWF1_34_20]KKP63373.1 MAG: Tryptophanyl-tRNA synthetase II [Candidatus Nomurabacteria bacterium GW2011_GWE2_34_25]KKP66565.1 MAG: Tryptophanyl-tRNA synthetase II [Candidatus Nomurabacteria bacterium GW2011_GWE1_35_16]KKP83611.1 MAG: Tryptophanyl-tRNA synthetase II [Candidatus Nomurabacteria bacterium GW2011_GWF2_35_66]HAE36871.1 tryptophan--tRNA ligase [Candidatus Nomurabacteria bacterium]
MSKDIKIVMTGDRPTGRLHLGHFVGSIQNRVKLQDEAEQSFYMIADLQALTDNANNPEKVSSNVLEVALDNLACGVDPKKTIMFVQSKIPEIAELTVLFLNLVTLARLKRNPTVKDEMRQKGFGENVPAGFLAYPVSQAADILFCKSNLIPVGEDQLPVIEQVNEIVDDFNRFYGKTFDRVKHLVGDTPRLLGIDGNVKMSKSLNNGIYLSDSFEEISKKVMSMYTDPKHIHVKDKGEVKGNVVFSYLDIFDPNKEEVAELKTQYKKGGLGDVIIKKRLIGVLENIIGPIRKKREELAKNPKEVMKILEEGTNQAQKIAQETMVEVRKALKINYF